MTQEPLPRARGTARGEGAAATAMMSPTWMQVGGAGKTPQKEPDAPALRPRLQTSLMDTSEAMPVPVGLGLTIHPDTETKADGDPTFLRSPGGRASPEEHQRHRQHNPSD